jgi:hypothetical protein
MSVEIYPEHIKGGYNHSVGEVGPASEDTLHMCQPNINKEPSASLRHTTHLLIERQVSNLLLEKKERESGAYLGEDLLH